ncbi:MAG: hypothetical protein Q4B48_01460 [Syntrophomonadaceae bacterium]|nr:hypothetical protein [Syntrophomonadaceae bacterium]
MPDKAEKTKRHHHSHHRKKTGPALLRESMTDSRGTDEDSSGRGLGLALLDEDIVNVTGGPEEKPKTSRTSSDDIIVVDMGGGPAANPLTLDEKTRLQKYKKGRLHQLVKKAGTLRESTPAKQLGPLGSAVVAIAKEGADKTKTAYGYGSSLTGSGLDTLTTINDARKLATHSKKGLVEVPVLGSILSCADALVTTGGYIKKIFELAKSNPGDITADDKLALLKTYIDSCLSVLESVQSIIDDIGMVVGSLPLVGAIMGSVSSGISLCFNLRDAVKAGKSRTKMKAQKSKAKAAIRSKDTAHAFTAEKMSRGKGTGKMGIRTSFEDVADAQTGKKRSKRLDEVTAKMQKNDDAGESGVRQDVEDYDMLSELQGANTKRLREAILQMIFNDLVGFAGSLATLDPTGVGSVVGGGMKAASGAGFAIRDLARGARQKARDKGVLGGNLNKSTANKEARRSHLAANLLNRIVALGALNLDGMLPQDDDKAEQVRNAMARYKEINQRVVALGMGYGPLLRANTKDEMRDTIRSGFYREA